MIDYFNCRGGISEFCSNSMINDVLNAISVLQTGDISSVVFPIHRDALTLYEYFRVTDMISQLLDAGMINAAARYKYIGNMIDIFPKLRSNLSKREIHAKRYTNAVGSVWKLTSWKLRSVIDGSF